MPRVFRAAGVGPCKLWLPLNVEMLLTVVQVHAVPMRGAPQLGLHSGEALRMWKEQVKWVLLWFTLSLLTCMHSAALVLALQYNLIAVVSPSAPSRALLPSCSAPPWPCPILFLPLPGPAPSCSCPSVLFHH